MEFVTDPCRLLAAACGGGTRLIRCGGLWTHAVEGSMRGQGVRTRGRHERAGRRERSGRGIRFEGEGEGDGRGWWQRR